MAHARASFRRGAGRARRRALASGFSRESRAAAQDASTDHGWLSRLEADERQRRKRIEKALGGHASGALKMFA